MLLSRLIINYAVASMCSFFALKKKEHLQQKVEGNGGEQEYMHDQLKKGERKVEEEEERQDIKRLPLYPLGKLSSTCVVF